MNDENKRKERFLRLMTQATMETGIVVAGCGCCGSPRLDAIGREKVLGGDYSHERYYYLVFLDKDGKKDG